MTIWENSSDQHSYKDGDVFTFDVPYVDFVWLTLVKQIMLQPYQTLAPNTALSLLRV